MDAVRTAALAAVAEVGPAWDGQAKVIQATKLVRDRTGCDLRAAIEAVKWAVDRPAAETLPAKSVVATDHAVFLKLDAPDEPSLPWAGTTDGMYTNRWGDDEIDDLLRGDTATILRVGGGAS